MLSDTPDISTTFIAHLSGYAIGIILYSMLLGLVYQSRRAPSQRTKGDLGKSSPRWLALWTGILGFVWNVGAFLAFLFPHIQFTSPLPALSALSVTALGFLPAMVVLAMADTQSMGVSALGRRVISGVGFLLSGWAGLWHVSGVWFEQSEKHAGTALEMMVWGFLLLLGGLLAIRVWAKGWDQMGRIVVFTGAGIAALPFSQHQTGDYSWGMELVSHHSNLLLALVILYHDYRFAFCDLFLKRALSFFVLTFVTLWVLITVGIPMLKAEPSNNMTQISRLTIFLALWVATALSYPYLQRGVTWLVDTLVLRRPDYEKLRQTLAVAINKQEEPQDILTTTASFLQPALLATHISWKEEDAQDSRPAFENQEDRKEWTLTHDAPAAMNSIDHTNKASTQHLQPSTVLLQTIESAYLIRIPTVDGPYFTLLIDGLLHGRRLLSDDLVLLEAVGHLVARRIDSVRSAHERCAITIREQEMKKLTVEAELRALRAQLNPHFLFNTLTTIGYLIQTTPDQALDTLLRLTELLRAVLRRLEGEFSTLGQEVDLVQSYLMIEQARFERRLVYHIDVPSSLRDYFVPALLLQPLVENAVKHGIQPSKEGGTIKISVERKTENPNSQDTPSAVHSLLLTVHDTGSGSESITTNPACGTGVGLSNIRKRLHLHYGSMAAVHIHPRMENGTMVQIQLPIPEAENSTNKSFSCTSSSQGKWP
ncbi:MAG: hypothetical protein NPIRA02_22140 [Nitrospirales bacterium]|nr:MAG: hypothetical protein NPIRA02_22140 [Nitrospirales bacterium]